MEKIPIKKIILGSIGACLALGILTVVVMVISSIPGLVVWAGVVLYAIENARQQLVKKYHIGFGKFMVLTMLPSVMLYGVFVCYYINNPQPELEGMLDQIILMVFGGCIGVSVVGTLIIALVRWMSTLCKKEKEDKVDKVE